LIVCGPVDAPVLVVEFELVDVEAPPPPHAASTSSMHERATKKSMRCFICALSFPGHRHLSDV